MSRTRTTVFTGKIKKPQAKKALVVSTEKYISVCVQKICEHHKVDSETALIALMSQCAKQMINPSHSVHKTDLLSELSQTSLGQRIARGDLNKLPEPDDEAETASLIQSKPTAGQIRTKPEKRDPVKVPFFKRI